MAARKLTLIIIVSVFLAVASVKIMPSNTSNIQRQYISEIDTQDIAAGLNSLSWVLSHNENNNGVYLAEVSDIKPINENERINAPPIRYYLSLSVIRTISGSHKDFICTNYEYMPKGNNSFAISMPLVDPSYHWRWTIPQVGWQFIIIQLNDYVKQGYEHIDGVLPTLVGNCSTEDAIRQYVNEYMSISQSGYQKDYLLKAVKSKNQLVATIASIIVYRCLNSRCMEQHLIFSNDEIIEVLKAHEVGLIDEEYYEKLIGGFIGPCYRTQEDRDAAFGPLTSYSISRLIDYYNSSNQRAMKMKCMMIERLCFLMNKYSPSSDLNARCDQCKQKRESYKMDHLW